MHLQKSIYIRSVAEMQTVSISSTSWECSACIPIMINVNVGYVRTMFLLIATKEIDIRNAELVGSRTHTILSNCCLKAKSDKIANAVS